MTIAQAFEGRNNNFNLLRMIAASSVLFSHSWSIAFAERNGEPLTAITPFSLGQLAVAVFFGLSGFLIAGSFENRKSVVEFATARVCRVYPGLLLSLVFCVFVVGAFSTTQPLSEYFSNPITLKFIPAGLSLFRLRYALPGVFENNPFFGVDGSLWTLYYEVFCYVSVAIVGLLGLLSRRTFTATLLIYFAVYAALRVHLGDRGSMGGYTELTLPFALGVAIFVYRAYVPLSVVLLIVLIASVIVLHQTELYRELLVIMIIYATFWVGLTKFSFLSYYTRVGDYSYGMYIFAFPIQQALAMLIPGITPWLMIAIAWPATLVLAIPSWHLVENPVLVKRHVIGALLNRRIRQVIAGRRPVQSSAMANSTAEAAAVVGDEPLSKRI